jgi:deoxyribonuclease-4
MTQQVNKSTRLLGAHMPAAGGIVGCLTGGKAIGCTAVQLFTSSPRQWQHKPIDPEVADTFKKTQRDLDIPFTIAHDSYLINLAAPNREILEKSREAFRAELDRAEALDIPWVVTHMGACMESTEDEGIALLCESMSRILHETEGMKVGIALETTAGQGTCLGHRFEHIARVVDGCLDHPRVGVCLDTCHIFVAGYDIRTDETFSQTFDSFGSLIGFDRLKAIHANDTKKSLGSKVDRHDHIGDGELGMETFRRLVTDPRLSHVPILIETPEAETMHAVNLAKLQRLAAGETPGLRVKVRFFGHFSDLWPSETAVEVPVGATIADLATSILAMEPKLTGFETICRSAVNEEYVTFNHALNPGDTVAFIPPMSGG